MDEIKNNQKKISTSHVPKLTRSGNSSRNTSQRKISSGSLNKLKKL
jgi:hypothetical protein